jgi:hypothetical protein
MTTLVVTLWDRFCHWFLFEEYTNVSHRCECLTLDKRVSQDAITTKEVQTMLNPGSSEAIAQGCTCPVLDNARGKGYLGGVKDEAGNTVFVISCLCPLHGDPKLIAAYKQERRSACIQEVMDK